MFYWEFRFQSQLLTFNILNWLQFLFNLCEHNSFAIAHSEGVLDLSRGGSEIILVRISVGPESTARVA